METEESNNQDSSKNCTDTIRPAKRLASNKNTLNAPNRASSGVSPAGSKSSNAQRYVGPIFAKRSYMARGLLVSGHPMFVEIA